MELLPLLVHLLLVSREIVFELALNHDFFVFVDLEALLREGCVDVAFDSAPDARPLPLLFDAFYFACDSHSHENVLRERGGSQYAAAERRADLALLAVSFTYLVVCNQALLVDSGTREST